MTSVSSKDKDFLQCFWDLASMQSSVRVAASAKLVTFVKKNLVAERDYALTRLVKGLGSSRDCARQGFATCLCELLLLPGVEVLRVLELLDDTTKVTGSLKGAEERDFLFSKLFCCICIIRSGKTNGNQEQQLDILTRLLDLHERKGWIREVVADTLLLFCSTLRDPTVITATLLKMKPLLTVAVTEMAAWQISLSIGLQQLLHNTQADRAKITAVWQAEWKKEMAALPVAVTPIAMSAIEKLTDTLLASTTGYPKIHRVWDYLMSFIFPMDQDRELPTTRSGALNATQEAALQHLTAFLDKHLLSASKEKRSVALHLTTVLVQRCPADFIPLALTPATVQCLKSARANKKHALHALAGTVLEQIAASAGSDVSCKLALISAFVQFGSANFDSLTSTHTVASLLSGLSYEAIVAHVNFLVGMVVAFDSDSAAPAAEGAKSSRARSTSDMSVESSASDSTTSTAGSSKEGGARESEEPDGGVSASLAASLSALEALVSLAKNNKLTNRGLVNTTVVTVLARLACFGTGTVQFFATQGADKKSTKDSKKDKKRKSSSGDLSESSGKELSVEEYYSALRSAHAQKSSLPLPAATVQAVKILDQVLASSEVPSQLAAQAGLKLLSILADSGATSLAQLDAPKQDAAAPTENAEGAGDVKESAAVASTPSVLQLVWSAVWQIHSSGVPLRVEDGDGEEATGEVTAAMKAVQELLTVEALVSQDSTQDGAARAAALTGKLSEALNTLLVNTLFTTLVGQDDDTQLIEGLVSIVPTLLLGPSEDSDSASADDDASQADSEEGDAQTRAQMQLFDISLELLSLNADQNQSTRGLRESVKKVWQCVCAIHGSALSVDVIDNIVSAVIGEQQGRDGEEGEEGDGEGSEQGSDAGSDDGSEADGSDSEMDVEDAKPAVNNAKKASAPAKASTKTTAKQNKTAASAETDTAEEEDVVISREDAFDMLTEGMEEADEEPGLQHSAELDDALAQMIALKQQSRKAGVLLAHRQALLVRSRSIDILEIVVQKIDRGVLLFPLFQPLLQSLSTSYNSLLTQSIAEGATYCNRLQNLVEQKLCKKKVSLSPALGDCTDEDVLEQFEPLAALLVKLLNSAIVPLRHIAHAAFLTVARSVWASGAPAAIELLSSTMKQLFVTYTTKKNTRISQKFIEDLVLNRLSDVSVPVLWGELVAKLGDSQQNNFMKQEVAHLFSSVVKKYNGLAVPAQDAARAHFAAGVSTLAAQVKAVQTESSSTSANNKGSSKKLKPLLSAIKDVTEFLKKATPGSGDNSKVVVFEQVTAVREGVSELQHALTELGQSLAPAVVGEEAKKGNQASSGILGQLKGIQGPLSAFLTATANSSTTTATTTPGKKQKDKAGKAEKSAAKAPLTAGKAVVVETVGNGEQMSANKRKQGSEVEEAVSAEVESSAVKKDKKAKKDKK